MQKQEKRRAHSMAELGGMHAQMFRPEEEAAGLAAYQPRPTDIIIAPYAKCGTTWLQQTFHTLRTRGDMDFEDISAVVPWIETAVALGIDIDGPQRAAPRGFKSHLAFDRLPRGARYVVSFREPKDALVSMYKFMECWLAEPGAIPISDLAGFWQFNPGQKPDYWRHLLSWWAQRDNPDVLTLSYEYMSAHPQRTIELLAEFSGIALDDDLLALTLKHSSIEFMLEHKPKYEDPGMRRLSEERCNIPAGGDSAKVRKGGSGGHRTELDEATIAAIDRVWSEVITPATGFATYADMNREIERRLQTRSPAMA